MIEDGWKLIVPDPKNEPASSVELYDIIEDPVEQHNAAGSNADRVDAMTEKINTWWPAT
jgi:hypothetical protein